MFRKPAWLAVALVFGGGAAAELLVDPTRPIHNLAPSLSTTGEEVLPRVSAILIGRNTRHAILNGVAVKVGESSGGFEVAAIDPGRVKLRRNGALVDLELLPSVKKNKDKVR